MTFLALTLAAGAILSLWLRVRRLERVVADLDSLWDRRWEP